MRLIGNKTRLLGHIQELLRDRGFPGGTLIDIFSGTSSVGRHFKRLGYRVLSNDHLSVGYTQAVAGVEVSAHPPFAVLRRLHRRTIASAEFRETLPPGPASSADPSLPLREAAHLLNRFVPPREGLIFRNYCPGGLHGRRYFQDHHGRKIDGALHFLREARRSRTLDRGELHLLLAALIDAADRVANISGTYGAYLKEWQVNTRGELRIEPPEVVESPHANRAYREDANALIRRLRGDVLYIDPPYNHRQYAANYHVLEVMAEHHRVEDLDAYEAGLYGKTGLRPYPDLRSAYCVRPGGACVGSPDVFAAMRDLILSSRARCVVVSYSDEGLLNRDEVAAILARFSGVRRFDLDRNLREIDFPRFRSDADRAPVGGRGGRTYRVVEGRERDRIGELLYFAERKGARRRGAPEPVSGARARWGTRWRG